MANDDYRDQHERDRAAGLAARHETRVERAIRRATAEEIAQAIEKASPDEPPRGDPLRHIRAAQRSSFALAAKWAREIGSRDPLGEHSNQATEETK